MRPSSASSKRRARPRTGRRHARRGDRPARRDLRAHPARGRDRGRAGARRGRGGGTRGRRPHPPGRRLLHAPPDARLPARRARALRPRVRRVVPPRPGRAARAAEADAPLDGSRRAGHARDRWRRGRRGGSVRHAARARRVGARAPAREGLRRHDAGGVRAGSPAHGRDRPDPPAPRLAPAHPRHPRRPARHASHVPQVAALGRRADRAAVEGAQDGSPKARRALRHLGLDGRLRASAPASTSMRSWAAGRASRRSRSAPG